MDKQHNDENSLKKYIAEHKAELIMLGIVTTATISALFLTQNWEDISNAVNGFNRKIFSAKLNSVTVEPTYKATLSTKKTTPSNKIVSVRKHFRTLSNGHPSALKIAEAGEAGIVLADNQTIVSAHQRRYAA